MCAVWLKMASGQSGRIGQDRKANSRNQSEISADGQSCKTERFRCMAGLLGIKYSWYPGYRNRKSLVADIRGLNWSRVWQLPGGLWTELTGRTQRVINIAILMSGMRIVCCLLSSRCQ